MTAAIVKQETQLTVGEAARIGTDIAGVCREIVKRTAERIGARDHVKVEGWQAIASAAGCGISIVSVEEEMDGFKAVCEVRRLSDGALVGRGEGYVGEDEPVWAGGGSNPRDNGKPYPRRPTYARRAMAQTRAISRACRSAFAFIVVLIDEKLSTTPAEEMPPDSGEQRPPSPKASPPVADFTPNGQTEAPFRTGVRVPFGKEKGKDLAEIDARSLSGLADYLRKQVDDPAKSSYRAKNQALVDSCVTEAMRREGK